MGAVNQLLAKRAVSVRQGRVEIHRDQGIVERFNRTLAGVRSRDAAPFRSKVDGVGCPDVRRRCRLKWRSNSVDQ